MKKLQILLLLVVVGFMANAQNVTITGQIMDAHSDSSIPFASVALFEAGNAETFKGNVSDYSGSFELSNIPKGTYRLEVSFIGYKKHVTESVIVDSGKGIVALETIRISPSNINLDEVEVNAMHATSQNSIDRKTYRAEDFATAKGGTATDILNKLPSVSVDPDGNVSVRGTSDFMVYLNGKPTQIDASILLGQISGNSIENIEVITVPTAKYDANGKGGIINISTKRKALEGLSIAENIMLGGAPWNNVTDKYSAYKLNDNRFGNGLNVMWGKDKVLLYGAFAMNNRNVNGLRVGDARILVNENLGVYKHMVAAGERPEWYRFWSANAGFEFELSKKSSISGSYFYGKRTDGRSAFYVYNIFYADKDKNTLSGYDRNESWIYNPNTDNRYGRFQTANLDFDSRFNDNSLLKISFLYEKSGLDRSLQNKNYSYDKAADQAGMIELSYAQTDETPLDAYRVSIDYSKDFDNGHTLSAGVQPQLLSIEGSFGYDTLGVAQDTWAAFSSLENSIDVKRNIYAGYLDYSGQVDKLSFVAGVRMEYTDQNIDILEPEYFSLFDGKKESNYSYSKFDLFPSLHLKYALTQKEEFSFAASRRISRPPVKNMAPFLYRRHLEVYVVGDPELEPEYVNNFELTFDKKLDVHSLSLTGFYRGVDNAIFRVNTITNENQKVLDVVQEEVLIRSYTNAGNTRALGAELNANISAGKFAKFFVGGSLYQFSVDSDIFGYQSKNQSTNWSLKANMNLMFSKELKFTTDFNVMSATVTAQGQNDLFFISNSALSYTPQRVSGLDVSVRVLDLFSTNNKGLDTKAYNSNGSEIFYQETEYQRQGPIVEFAVSYALNMKGKAKKSGGSTFGKSEF